MPIKIRIGKFTKEYVAFFVALLLWLGFWQFGFSTLAYLFFPFNFIVAIALFLVSPFFILSKKYRIIPIMVWTGPVALGLLYVLTSLVSFAYADYYRYYIGIDVSTPHGDKTFQSMVEIQDSRTLSFGWGVIKVKGDAVFCDLGNNKNLVVTLAFPKDQSGHTLQDLPWRANGHRVGYDDKSRPIYQSRIELKENLVPFMVTFTDANDRMSMKRVNHEKLEQVFGTGYSIKSVWVKMTQDAYKNSGLRDHLPWLASHYDNPFERNAQFRAVGLGSVSQPLERRD
ncbi:MAG: hypothetical protein AB7D39_15560 [Pseudodesulfovibrio sp.]|uniref:hypothetical protein n=1 Tax=Pseudodesulfovibrio sp. TaxID=2035812 RepID=UPI003D0B5141